VSATGQVDEDLAGVACFSGTFPDLEFHPSVPFPVGGGAIAPS
jgi:hypothetical protein